MSEKTYWKSSLVVCCLLIVGCGIQRDVQGELRNRFVGEDLRVDEWWWLTWMRWSFVCVEGFESSVGVFIGGGEHCRWAAAIAQLRVWRCHSSWTDASFTQALTRWHCQDLSWNVAQRVRVQGLVRSDNGSGGAGRSTSASGLLDRVLFSGSNGNRGHIGHPFFDLGFTKDGFGGLSVVGGADNTG
jgi:hypothetical protein